MNARFPSKVVQIIGKDNKAIKNRYAYKFISFFPFRNRNITTNETNFQRMEVTTNTRKDMYEINDDDVEDHIDLKSYIETTYGNLSMFFN